MQEHFKTSNEGNFEGGKRVMAPEELEQFIKTESEKVKELVATEEEGIVKNIVVVEKVIADSREEFELSENPMENPRWRDMVDRLEKTPEAAEIVEILYSLEDEILDIMKKFFNGEKELERVISLLMHAHREIKRMRTQGTSGK